MKYNYIRQGDNDLNLYRSRSITMLKELEVGRKSKQEDSQTHQNLVYPENESPHFFLPNSETSKFEDFDDEFEYESDEWLIF